MVAEKRVQVTTVLSTRASVLSPEQLRRATFEKYRYWGPWNVMPALKGRVKATESSSNDPIALHSTQKDGGYTSWIASRISDRLRGVDTFTANKITYAIVHARDELMQMESVKTAGIERFDVNVTALTEKGEPTLFVINFQIISEKQVDENSTRMSREHRYSTQARLTVSTSKESDVDAQRITNFSNRIGMLTFVSLHEQNPAEKPRGHYGEQMRAQVQALTQELEATKKGLDAREKALRELQGQVATLESDVEQKKQRINILGGVVDSLKLIIKEALDILRKAGLGNRKESIELTVTKLEEESGWKK